MPWAFKLDHRGLGAFRWLLGAALAYQAFQLFPDRRAFLSDAGIFARYQAVSNFPTSLSPSFQAKRDAFSLWFLFGSPLFATVAVLGYLVLSTLFMIGVKINFVHRFLWICNVGLMVRNPIVMTHSDFVLSAALFWSLFLSSLQTYSVDSVLSCSCQQKKKNQASELDHFAKICLSAIDKISVMCFSLQFMLIGVIGAMSCFPEETGHRFIFHDDYTHLGLIISSCVPKLILSKIASYLTVIQVKTRITYQLARFGLLCLLLPWARIRCFLLIVVLAANLGLFVLFNTDTSLSHLVWLVAFLPSGFWEALPALAILPNDILVIAPKTSHPVEHFFYHWATGFLGFQPAGQSEKKTETPDNTSDLSAEKKQTNNIFQVAQGQTWLRLICQQKRTENGAALFTMLQKIRMPWRLLTWLLNERLCDAVGSFIYNLTSLYFSPKQPADAKSTSTSKKERPQKIAPFWSPAAIIPLLQMFVMTVLFCWMLAINSVHFGFYNVFFYSPQAYDNLAYHLGISQNNWSTCLATTNNLHRYEKYLLQGNTSQGSPIEFWISSLQLIPNGPPGNIQTTNPRWALLMHKLLSEKSDLAESLGCYFCREYNRKDLRNENEFAHMYQISRISTKGVTPLASPDLRGEVVYSHKCFD